MRARFDVELSGVYEWEPLERETQDESIYLVKAAIEHAVTSALRRFAPDWRTEPLSVFDISFSDVVYDRVSTGMRPLPLEKSSRIRNDEHSVVD